MKRLTIMLAFVLVTSCASLGPKEKALQTYQTIHAALSAVQDAERLLCLPDATAPTHCLSKLAPTLGLTDAKHQELNGLLSRAFAHEIVLGQALKAWRAGDPPPVGLAGIAGVAKEILAVAESFVPNDSDVRRILAGIRAVLDLIETLNFQVGVK